MTGSKWLGIIAILVLVPPWAGVASAQQIVQTTAGTTTSEPSFQECKQHWHTPANVAASVHSGRSILHRLYEIANDAPVDTTLTPGYYDSVFGLHGREQMLRFGIESIERRANSVKLILTRPIQEGNADGSITIGAPLNDGSGKYVVTFTVSKSGVPTVVTNMTGVVAHGTFLGLTVNSPVNGFTMHPLEDGYLYAPMDSQYKDKNLCATPDRGIANE